MRTPSRAFIGTVVFAVAVAAFSRIPLLPEIGADLSLSAGEIGLLITAFGLGRLLMDLPAGRLAGAVAPVTALAAAGVGLAASCAWFAAAGSMLEALVASALIGCATALTNTTGMFAFATATGAERRGASLAIYTGALMSGQMAGPALGGLIGSLADWRLALAIAAGVGAAVAIACLVIRRRGLRGSAHEAAAVADPIDPITAGEPGPTRRELIVLAACAFATFFGLAGVIQTLVPLIGDAELGLSPSTIGIAIAIGAAARFSTAWVAGVGSDRFSRKAVLVPSLLLMALGAAVLALSQTRGAWVVAIVLTGLGSSSIAVAAAALADIVPRKRLGPELGLFRLIGDFGLLIGPAVAGFLYQASGAGLAAGASSAVFLAAGVAAAAWLREPGPGAPEGRETGERADEVTSTARLIE